MGHGWVPFKIVSDSSAPIQDGCLNLIWNKAAMENWRHVYFWCNLHKRYKSAERKISQKIPEYMLNCSLPCSCS
jgi:hypothetical protein